MTIDDITAEIAMYHAVDPWGVQCVWRALGEPYVQGLQGYRDRWSIGMARNLRWWETYLSDLDTQIANLDEDDPIYPSRVRARARLARAVASHKTSWLAPSHFGPGTNGWPESERVARVNAFITTYESFGVLTGAEKIVWAKTTTSFLPLPF